MATCFKEPFQSLLRNLKGIIELDFSRNNLSGQIPKYLEEFHFLQYLNLSFNNFEGEVPKGGIFRNASAISVDGNSKLCGGIPELQLPGCLQQASKKRGKPLASRVKVTVITVVLSSFLISCIIVALYWRKNSPKKASSPSSTENQWLQVSYADLLQATDGFSSANVIGVGSFGSVYKGILECFETLVAVKTPIIHRDLKPSSVLLDDDMVAHVGDFALARFLSEAAESFSQNQTSTFGIKGSIGYIPPEFGMGGKASIHGDVYSYGILLLEMITGKRPTDDMFKDNLSLHHFAKSAFPKQNLQGSEWR
ncbi:probable LRR receptor-like serine/threonine-protein kinase At3g47570 [Magnolia sinica]|uniref:probable LRR receptor-like serine/threonine-protein kinase At3g47570 n=1 Tax=Magnolia sinica TaxID=86752 RepID=UPI00265AF77C|nr:probable LRR receptor-like serine/threonine-protein kinase At3g47570 [Magnolia sinica]